MKKLLGGVAVSALLAAPAFAADLPARMPVKAAPAPVVAVYNWTGFYIGAHVGAARLDVKRTDDAGGILNNYDETGWLAGGQAGYRWQTGQFVFGLEVSGAGGKIDPSAPCPNPAFTCKTEANWLFLGGGQLGLAWNQFLIYASGGFAATKTETTSAPAFPGFNSDNNHHGWYVGGGFDIGLTPNWTLGFEYIHAEFNSKRYADPTGANIPYTIDPEIDLFRVKLNYRFGGSPVVARY
jgi:outer membrane immunogenic protein